jgi:hypothetical protein
VDVRTDMRVYEAIRALVATSARIRRVSGLTASLAFLLRTRMRFVPASLEAHAFKLEAWLGRPGTDHLELAEVELRRRGDADHRSRRCRPFSARHLQRCLEDRNRRRHSIREAGRQFVDCGGRPFQQPSKLLSPDQPVFAQADGAAGSKPG